MYLKNHGIKKSLIDRTFELVRIPNNGTDGLVTRVL